MDFPRSGGAFYACFNSRESDKRAGRKAVLEAFGVDGWKKIKKINRTGLLAMFHVDPTPETQLYANVIAARVEARFEKEDKWMFSEPNRATPGQVNHA